MQPKYQIFVSSTYEDLKKERTAVIKAILEMGHIPVGMEMFSAADEEQWQIIKRQIDVSDYYVVLVKQRYGSLTDGISYTEKEYDYAVSVGVPTLGFIVKDSVAVKPDFYERDPDSKDKLEKFKSKIKRKPVGFWKSAASLKSLVTTALMKAFNIHKRPGWVRSTEAASPETLAEMSRLSSENSELRGKLKDYDQSLEFNGISFDKLIEYLSKPVPSEIDHGDLNSKLAAISSVIKINEGNFYLHFFYLYRNRFLSVLKFHQYWWGANSHVIAILNLLLKYDLIAKFDSNDEQSSFAGQSYLRLTANYQLTPTGRRFLVRLEEVFDCSSIDNIEPKDLERLTKADEQKSLE